METGKRKKSIFAWALLPAVLSLAWPTMLEQLMQTAVQYIDTAMVGSLGTAATAAVGSTLTVNWLIGSTVSAFGVGFLAQIAQAFGAGDEGLARRAAAQSVLAVLVLGTLFTALTLSLSGFVPVWMQVEPALRQTAARYFFVLYLPMLPRTALILFGTVLRAAGDTKTPMRIGLRLNLVNVAGNFLLIYAPRTVTLFGMSVRLWGAGWGVVGAAAGSAIAFLYGGLAITRALSALRHLAGLCGLCGDDQRPRRNGHRRPHHCQHGRVRLLHPRLRHDVRRRHADRQRHRRGRRAAEEGHCRPGFPA